MATGTGLGLPTARGASSQLEMARGKDPCSSSLGFHIYKICNLFKNKSAAHAQRALELLFYKLSAVYEGEPSFFLPHKVVFTSSKKNTISFFAV